MSISSCCKEESEPVPATIGLPAQTNVGRNIFGCLVNGKVWVPESSFILISPLRVDYSFGRFSIDARNEDGSLLIQMDSINIVGDFVINNLTPDQSIYYSEEAKYYLPNNSYTGILTITKLDTIDKIISGRFYFDAIDSASTNVVKITDGRFDVKY